MKPINFIVVGINLLTTLAVLGITRFYNIPGRVFKAFIYNTYALNLIYLLFDIPYQIFEEKWFYPDHKLNRSIMAIGLVCKFVALTGILPYTAIRFYFLVGYKNSEERFSPKQLLKYVIFYDLILFILFYIINIPIILHPNDQTVLTICKFIYTTFQLIFISASVTTMVCTTLFIKYATEAQKLLMATRESLPDRQKIIRICWIQTTLYAIMGAMEVAKLIATLNYYDWKCTHRNLIYVVEYGRALMQQICVIIFALVVICCLNAYRKALKDIRHSFRRLSSRVSEVEDSEKSTSL